MKKLLASTILILALFATSCSSGLDRDAEIDSLVEEAGLTREVATCLVDEMIEEFGEDKLTSDDDPTNEEQAKILELMGECVAG